MLHDIIGLDAKLMRAFLLAAEELHFRRAAERMHMTQPPFSQLIRRLEGVVGVALFERTTRSVRLTPAGQVMHRCLRDIGGRMQAMVQEVREADQGIAGSINVGMAPTAACSALAERLYAFRRAHPGIELRLHEMNSHMMEAALLEHSLDVALMRPLAMGAAIETACALEEPLLLATHRDGPLRAEGPVELDRLEGEAFIGYVRERSPYFHEMLRALFSRSDQRPVIVQESILPTVLTLVEAGVGSAIVPRSAAEARHGTLTFLPFSTPGMPTAQIILARRRETRFTKSAVDRFFFAVQQSHDVEQIAPITFHE